MILCSSGTTGRYKSVCVSHAVALEKLHKRLLVWLVYCLEFEKPRITAYWFHFRAMNGEDIMMDFSSIYALGGFGTLIASTWTGATRVITTEVFKPELMLNIIEKYKVIDQ